jgi:predicted DNA-binding transcriptional regulator AlpA
MTSMRKDRAAEDEPMPERLWTIKDSSDFLGVPVATLYYWHSRGEGPRPFKAGRHLRYDPRAVMRWVESSAA